MSPSALCPFQWKVERNFSSLSRQTKAEEEEEDGQKRWKWKAADVPCRQHSFTGGKCDDYSFPGFRPVFDCSLKIEWSSPSFFCLSGCEMGNRWTFFWWGRHGLVVVDSFLIGSKRRREPKLSFFPLTPTVWAGTFFFKFFELMIFSFFLTKWKIKEGEKECKDRPKQRLKYIYIGR